MSEEYDIYIGVKVQERDKEPLYFYSTKFAGVNKWVEENDSFASIKDLSESINGLLSRVEMNYFIQNDPQIKEGIKGKPKVHTPIIIRGMTLEEKRTLADLLC